MSQAFALASKGALLKATQAVSDDGKQRLLSQAVYANLIDRVILKPDDDRRFIVRFVVIAVDLVDVLGDTPHSAINEA